MRLPTCIGVSGDSSCRNSASRALRCLMAANNTKSKEMEMERKKASDFPPEVLSLFDGYVHGSITRREFLDRSARYAAGGVTAAAFLEALSPNFAWAQQ